MEDDVKFPTGVSRRQFVSAVMSSAALACLPKTAGAYAGSAAWEHALLQGGRPHGPDAHVALLAAPFPMEQVRLLDGPFLDATKANLQYLHSLPVDRLVHNFRVNAGLASAAEPLGGWEAPDCELRGHFTGHFLSACALGYASTGDEELKKKGEAVVAELAKCQEAKGNGYLSAFPEDFFDRLSDGKDVWAPFYTLHKIMAGNLDMYTYCPSPQARAGGEGVGGGVGDWANGDHDQN